MSMPTPTEVVAILALVALFFGLCCLPPKCRWCGGRDWDTSQLPRQRTCRNCGHRIRG